MSERLGRDIGVPETVERMLVPINGLLKVSDEARKEYLLFTRDIMAFNVNMFADKCQNVDGHNFRNLMIEGYLLGTDFVSPLRVRDHKGILRYNGLIPDEHGRNQLEGELKRYYAQIWMTNPRELKNLHNVLHRKEVFVYCNMHGLREEAYNNFAKKLNLDAGREFD